MISFIIDEVKSFLGINKNSSLYDFDLYNQNLGILKNDYHLTKVDNISNNIIYIKIKLNKEHSEIKSYNDIAKIPKIIKLIHNNSKLTDSVIKLRKKNNSELNLKKIINDSFMTINGYSKNPSKENCIHISRNRLIKKYRNNNDLLTKNNSNKIDKDTATDDLAQITNAVNDINKYDYETIFRYNNSLVNLKNINYILKNINKTKLNKKNLSSLDYNPYFREKKTNNFLLKLVNKYKTIRIIRRKKAFLNGKNIDNISAQNKALYSYQDRKKFVKSLYESYDSSGGRIKRNLNLSQPNIIKSYMEIYVNNIKNNKIYARNND